MNKQVSCAADLVGSPELFVLDYGFTADGEGWVLIGSPEPAEAGGFEGRRLAQRHAESRMGWRSAGLTGVAPADVGVQSHKVLRDGKEQDLELYCFKIRVAGE